MAFVCLRGVNHYYEWITPYHNIPDARKPTIVFIHGWAGSARYWHSTALQLQQQFNCLLYDLRGFGRSLLPPVTDGLRDYALESYADDLRDLLDALGLDRVWINGHSTGASIAVLFSNLYPERLDRMILTCSGIFEYQALAFQMFHFVSRYVVLCRPSWFVQIPYLDRLFMARFLYQSIPTEESRAFLADFVTADGAAALGTVYTAVSKEAAMTMPQAFAQVSVPTLLISGQYDQIIPAEMGERAASLNDRIEYACLANTAHFPMLEDAPAYFACLEKFL